MPSSDPAQHAQYLARRTFSNLDGLRCVSILAVLWYHMPIQWQRPLPIALARGHLGVDLFFVISGFLITTLLLRERERTGRIALGAFYARRTLRIFPLYFAVLGGLAVWVANDPVILASGADQTFFERMPYYLTYTSNLAPDEIIFSPSWSLATEEQFYLLWPPLLAFALPSLRWLALVAVLAWSLAANWGFADGTDLHPAFKATACTPIVLGVGLAFCLHRAATFRALAPLLARRGAILLPVLLIAWSISSAGPRADAALQPGDLRGWGRLGVHVGFVWLVGCAVVREGGVRAVILQAAPVRWIGRISYGIYLLQIPVLLYITLHLVETQGRLTWLPTEAAGWAAAFVGSSVLLATASWFTLERAFLRLKGRFQR